MKNNEFTIDGTTYIQIQKRTAEKLYNQGEKIYLLPCKVNPYGRWIQLSPHMKHTTDAQEFTKFVNEWKFHNCHSELGTYPNFYIIEE